MAIHKKNEDELENVKTAQELLNISLDIVSEKKQAVKTMNMMLADTAKTYGVNKKILSSARDIAFTKGKGWKNDNPFDLDADAEIKDKTSQLFMKVRDTIKALNEIGNIVSGSYLNALAGLTGLKMVCSVPSLTVDMVGALLSVPAAEFGKYGDKMLMIQSQFGEEEFVTGYFLLIPELESYDKILNSLGM